MKEDKVDGQKIKSANREEIYGPRVKTSLYKITITNLLFFFVISAFFHSFTFDNLFGSTRSSLLVMPPLYIFVYFFV